MTRQVRQLRVVSPCNQDRDLLDGSGAERWCPDCRKTVYDFELMRRDAVDAVCAGGEVCGIASYHADGSLRTADPVALPVLFRRRFLEWGAAAMLSARLASAQDFKLPVLPKAEGGVVGVVTDASGAAVAGARVEAGASVAFSDGLGRFVLQPVEPAEVMVKIQAAGFRIGKRQAAVRPGVYVDLGKVPLQAGMVGETVVVFDSEALREPLTGAVEVELRAAPGQAAPGLWVRLVRAGALPNELRVRADDAGRFRFAQVPVGEYELVVEGLGWVTHREKVVIGRSVLQLGQILMRGM